MLMMTGKEVKLAPRSSGWEGEMKSLERLIEDVEYAELIDNLDLSVRMTDKGRSDSVPLDKDQRIAELEARVKEAEAERDELKFEVSQEVVDLDDKLVEAQSKLDAALADNARLRKALSGLLENVGDLMSESYGVIGLHLNGDNASWGSISDAGEYGEWLPLEKYRAALYNVKK
jgi:vacuolar-type H+-ATPase subunit I/STV1